MLPMASSGAARGLPSRPLRANTAMIQSACPLCKTCHPFLKLLDAWRCALPVAIVYQSSLRPGSPCPFRYAPRQVYCHFHDRTVHSFTWCLLLLSIPSLSYSFARESVELSSLSFAITNPPSSISKQSLGLSTGKSLFLGSLQTDAFLTKVVPSTHRQHGCSTDTQCQHPPPLSHAGLGF